MIFMVLVSLCSVVCVAFAFAFACVACVACVVMGGIWERDEKVTSHS